MNFLLTFSCIMTVLYALAARLPAPPPGACRYHDFDEQGFCIFCDAPEH